MTKRLCKNIAVIKMKKINIIFFFEGNPRIVAKKTIIKEIKLDKSRKLKSGFGVFTKDGSDTIKYNISGNHNSFLTSLIKSPLKFIKVLNSKNIENKTDG